MREDPVILDIGLRLRAAAPAGSRIVLFGSRARADADSRSDYDVLVIEPHVANSAEESVRLRRELDTLRVAVDVVVVGAATARRRALVRGTLVERAEREGRLLAVA